MRESLDNDTDKPMGKVATFLARLLHRLGELQPNVTFDRKAAIDQADTREAELVTLQGAPDMTIETNREPEELQNARPVLRLLQGGKSDDTIQKPWQPPRRPPSGTAA